jgi:hypothetical protein
MPALLSSAIMSRTNHDRTEIRKGIRRLLTLGSLEIILAHPQNCTKLYNDRAIS